MKTGNKLLCLLMLVIAGGCQPPETAEDSNTGRGENERLRIAVIPKGTTHIFWKSVHYGARQAAEELDVEILWEGPQRESDRTDQIDIVQSFVNKRVDGICLAPLDANALVRPVEAAVRSGIPVVIFDSGLEDAEKTIVSYVATDNRRGGRLAAETMAEALGGEGNVVLLRYNKGSESTMQREEGFLEAIAEHKGINVLSSDQYAGTTTESSVDKAQQMINRYQGQIDGIFAVCEPNAEGVHRALIDANIAKDVVFVGFDPSESLRRALEAGEMDAIVLQDPVQMGYTAVKTIVESIRGGEVESFIDTGVYVATPENMDDPEIAKLLQPETT